MSTVVDAAHATLSEWSSVIVGIATLISAIGSAFAAIMSTKNGYRITEIHDATNGMKAELVKVTGDKRYNEGVAHGENFPRRVARKLVRRRKLKRKVKKG